jgi:hypothetical protein
MTKTMSGHEGYGTHARELREGMNEDETSYEVVNGETRRMSQ